MDLLTHRKWLAFIALLILSGCAHSQPKPQSQVPAQPKLQTFYQKPVLAAPQSKAIVVPNNETAIQIARAIWIPIYGEKIVQLGKTFIATLEDGIWTVNAEFGSGAIEAGTAIMDISQEDGRVSRMAHGQFQPGSKWH